MITFEEARQLVQHSLRGSWSPKLGTLVTLPSGFEESTHWRVIAGAREALVDGDRDFDLMDAPAFLVSKTTGAVERLVVIDNLDRLDSMTPVDVSR